MQAADNSLGLSAGKGSLLEPLPSIVKVASAIFEDSEIESYLQITPDLGKCIYGPAE